MRPIYNHFQEYVKQTKGIKKPTREAEESFRDEEIDSSASDRSISELSESSFDSFTMQKLKDKIDRVHSRNAKSSLRLSSNALGSTLIPSETAIDSYKSTLLIGYSDIFSRSTKTIM